MKAKLMKSALWILPLMGVVASGTGTATAVDDLASVHESVARRYKAVSHISAEALEGMMGPDTLLFDVRSQSEFNVSHIKGAERISPGLSRDDFIKIYGARAKGNKLIFYCSVGYRSSKLASRVQKDIAATDATEVYNLRGGIFEWHNGQRPLVNQYGVTDFIHPYDKSWGSLIERAEQIRDHLEEDAEL